MTITPRREDAGLGMGEFSSWEGESKGWRCVAPGAGDLEALSRLDAGGSSWCCPPPPSIRVLWGAGENAHFWA